MEPWYLIFIAGAAGALIKDILADGCLELPKIKEGKLGLGFLGGLMVGGAAGYYIDGSLITAAMAGLSANVIIQGLVDGIKPTTPSKKETIQELIIRICVEEKVDPLLGLKVAECESSFNPTARNTSITGNIDRGLYQISTKWHPEVSDKQADDPEFATRFFCKQVNAGLLSDWDSSKQCWGKLCTLT